VHQQHQHHEWRRTTIIIITRQQQQQQHQINHISKVYNSKFTKTILDNTSIFIINTQQ